MKVARNEVLKITFHSCYDSTGGLMEKNEYAHNPTYLSVLYWRYFYNLVEEKVFPNMLKKIRNY